MGSPLARFVLMVAAWLPVTFAIWYLAAPVLVWPVAMLAELFTRSAFGDLVRGVEQSGALLTFVTSLKPASGEAGNAKAVLSVESNVLLFSFGLPMLVALILAAREPHVVRRIVIGYVVLLPFQTWGTVADFLKNIAILAGPAVSAQTGFNAWQREAIAFSYQFGTLILPTVVPAIVWVLMHRRFLENFASREQPQASPR
ncbi:MAG TPA: exosortase H-associated membrane protein [Casimicrobiaceae bacterium]|nr:exosortase H-associated membrane protein [Casimicrobiaceae bacterium]